MKNLLWYLLAGTRGGETRAKIMFTLKTKPMNAHQIAKFLKLDYKTIQYHLSLLTKNGALSPINQGKYGAVYFISQTTLSLWRDLGEIWERFGKK